MYVRGRVVALYWRRLAAVGAGVLVLVTSVAAACDQSEGLKRQNNAANGTPEAGRKAKSGMVAVHELRDGDCVTADIGFFRTSFAKLERVPCASTEATYRVSRMFTIGAASDSYPGDAYIEKQAGKCSDAVLYPTKKVWELGGRTIICFAEK